MLKVNWTNPQGKTFSYYPASDVEARDAQLKNLVEDFERSAKSCEIERVRLGYNISGACMAGRVGAYGECARKLKALLLV